MFIMSYGYNTTSPRQGGEIQPGIEPIVGEVWPLTRLRNEKAVEMETSRAPIKKRPAAGKSVFDYFATVRKRAMLMNRRLTETHSPFRVQAYADDQKRVFIEFSLVDKNGQEIGNTKRDVTDEDFGRLMDNLSTGMGLIVDDVPGWKIR